MKKSKSRFIAGLALVLALFALAPGVIYTDFNLNQFGTNSYRVYLRDGVLLTNAIVMGRIGINTNAPHTSSVIDINGHVYIRNTRGLEQAAGGSPSLKVGEGSTTVALRPGGTDRLTVSASTTTTAGGRVHLTAHKDANYTVAVSDYRIVSLNYTAAVTNTLVAPTTATSGQTWEFADGAGQAATTNIWLKPASGTINGAAAVAIAADFGQKVVWHNGTNYFAR